MEASFAPSHRMYGAGRPKLGAALKYLVNIRVCPSLSEVEDVPLKHFPKLAFYWSASATTKLILESLRKLTARSWAGSGRFRGNEARSDHDLAVSLAI